MPPITRDPVIFLPSEKKTCRQILKGFGRQITERESQVLFLSRPKIRSWDKQQSVFRCQTFSDLDRIQPTQRMTEIGKIGSN
jgi:hypothetical protein